MCIRDRFWGWLRSFIQYSFVPVVAIAFLMIFEQFVFRYVTTLPPMITQAEYGVYALQAFAVGEGEGGLELQFFLCRLRAGRWRWRVSASSTTADDVALGSRVDATAALGDDRRDRLDHDRELREVGDGRHGSTFVVSSWMPRGADRVNHASSALTKKYTDLTRDREIVGAARALSSSCDSLTISPRARPHTRWC